MAITLDEARDIRDALKTEYQTRHTDFKLLRKFWHGQYFEIAERSNSPISSVFKDMPNRSAVTPDWKIIHNVLQEVCVKYQTYLSTLPQISMYIDPPGSQQRRAQADRKERFLYGVWDMGNMLQRLSDVSWFLPLFGHGFIGCFPDAEQKIPRPIVRSPEYAYPITNFDGETEGVIFSWKIPERVAVRNFPKYKPSAGKPKQARGRWFSKPGPDESEEGVEVLEYSDNNCFYRWVGDTMVAGVEHKFGWNVFDEMKFINVPGEPWGHGAVEQAVSMVEMGSMLYSLLFQAVLENVFPVLHINDPSKAPEEMDMGPGGVVTTNPGGGVEWLHPPVQAIASQVGFLNENERAIKQATGMPDVNFGQFRASIVTGKAINELQGAGTGSTVEMVQSIGIGNALVNWNAKAIEMTRALWADESIPLFGLRPQGMAEVNPRRFAMSIKGSELVGSTRNSVTFLPYLNMHEKVVMGLQMAGAGLVSKRWQRDQVGIPDSEAMEEEMVGEVISDAVIQTIIGSMAQTATPEAAADAEQQAVGYLAGNTHLQPAVPMPGQAPAPGLPTGAPGPLGPPPPGGAPPGGGGPPIGPLGPGAPGQAMSPAIQLPPGSPPPDMLAAGLPGAPPGAAPPEGAPPEAPSGSGEVSLEEVKQAIQGLNGIQGKVYLVGRIVAFGSTDGDIETQITVASDQQVIEDSLPQWAGRFTFRVVGGEPDEDFVEVTPGATATVPPPPEGSPGPAAPPEGAPA